MQTLVLDVGYRPIQRVPWETAIVWALERAVDVIDEYPDRYINTVSWRVKMPSVVRFVKPIKRKRAVKFSRRNLYVRDKKQCQYCAWPVARDRFTYDHVVPRSQGGATTWENVVVCCVACNQRKGGRTPEQAGMRCLTRPRKPTAKEIEWSGPEVVYEEGMPEQWRAWLRDAAYWQTELEHD